MGILQFETVSTHKVSCKISAIEIQPCKMQTFEFVSEVPEVYYIKFNKTKFKNI